MFVIGLGHPSSVPIYYIHSCSKKKISFLGLREGDGESV